MYRKNISGLSRKGQLFWLLVAIVAVGGLVLAARAASSALAGTTKDQREAPRGPKNYVDRLHTTPSPQKGARLAKQQEKAKATPSIGKQLKQGTVHFFQILIDADVVLIAIVSATMVLGGTIGCRKW